MAQHDLTGTMAQPLGLVVQFTCGHRGAKRIEYVKVPWDQVFTDEASKHNDRAVMQALIGVWAAQDEAEQMTLDYDDQGGVNGP